MTNSDRRQSLATLLRERVVAQLALGLIQPGEQLPGARELAKEYSTDPRFILDAFRELQREDVVEMRSRSGVYVAPERSAPLAQQTEWLTELLFDALRQGTTVSDVPALITRGLQTLNIRAAIIDCNDDELWSSHEELLRDYGINAATFLLSDASANGRYAPEIRAANLIVTTRAHAESVARIAQQVGASFCALDVDAELFGELGRLLLTTDVSFIVSDERYALKARHLLSQHASVDGLHLYVVGRDVLPELPVKRALYISPLARQQLLGGTRAERELAQYANRPLRRFSAETSRTLLRFIATSNLAAQSTAPMP